MSNTGRSALPNVANNTGPLSEKAALDVQARSVDQKVQSYLEGVPEGLYLHHMMLTENDKKKLVVKRLEKIFTGKMGGRIQLAEETRQQSLFQMDSSMAQSCASLPAILPCNDRGHSRGSYVIIRAGSSKKGLVNRTSLNICVSGPIRAMAGE